MTQLIGSLETLAGTLPPVSLRRGHLVIRCEKIRKLTKKQSLAQHKSSKQYDVTWPAHLMVIPDGKYAPLEVDLLKADNDSFFLFYEGTNDCLDVDDVIDVAVHQLPPSKRIVSFVRENKALKDNFFSEEIAKVSDVFISIWTLRKQKKLSSRALTGHYLVCSSKEATESLYYALLTMANKFKDHSNPSVLMALGKTYRKMMLSNGRYRAIEATEILRAIGVPQTKENLNRMLLAGNLKKGCQEAELGEVLIKKECVTFESFWLSFLTFFELHDANRVMRDILAQTRTNVDKKQHSNISYEKLSLTEFCDFVVSDHWQAEQSRYPKMFYSYSADDATLFGRMYGLDERDGKISVSTLQTYLFSDHNLVVDNQAYKLCQDMSYPLSHYFINSSHNTYLTGNQLASHSTAKMYRLALMSGCRCVELDIWPGWNDRGQPEPFVTHGRTLCTQVPFKDCLRAIQDTAFITSKYPVILSFENHCKTTNLQSKMASYLLEIFHTTLVEEPLDDYPLTRGTELPSPTTLSRRILLKSKKQMPSDAPVDIGWLTQCEGGRDQPAAYDDDGARSDNWSALVCEDGWLANEANRVSLYSAISKKGTGSSEARKEKKGTAGIDARQSTMCDIQSGLESNRYAHAINREVSTRDYVTGVDEPEPEEGCYTEHDDLVTPVTQPSQTSNSLRARFLHSLSRSLGSAGGLSRASKAQASFPNQPRPSQGSVQRSLFNRLSALRTSFRLQDSHHSEGDDIADHEDLLEQEEAGIDGVYEVAVRCAELASLVNYVQPVKFSCLQDVLERNMRCEMSSFNEKRVLRIAKRNPEDAVRYTNGHLCRVYPKGTRVTSSNFGPQRYWNFGAQLVSLNFQTVCSAVELNFGRFSLNHSCGYLLKPKYLCAETSCNYRLPRTTMCKLRSIYLDLEVVSGLFLSKTPRAIYIAVDIIGTPTDSHFRRFCTKPCQPNDVFHPFWEEKLITNYRVDVPEIAVLRIAAISVSPEFEVLGSRHLPLHLLKSGYRYVPLLNHISRLNELESVLLHLHVHRVQRQVQDHCMETLGVQTHGSEVANYVSYALAREPGQRPLF